jgi:hypothetical protein
MFLNKIYIKAVIYILNCIGHWKKCFKDIFGELSWSWSYGTQVVGYITTYAISAYHHNDVSSNPAHGEVYSIQHYMIKFLSDLPQVSGFLFCLIIVMLNMFLNKIYIKAVIYILNCIGHWKKCFKDIFGWNNGTNKFNSYRVKVRVMMVSFNGGGNRSTRRKPLTCGIF